MSSIFTIGFTQTSAENFFSRLQRAGVRSVLDVRLRADSQLSGFAKKKDLAFFLRNISGIEYQHSLDLAPSASMLDDYKKKKINWQQYEKLYVDLIKERAVESKLSIDGLGGTCLLCSESLPHQCHRRLAAEYLSKAFGSSVEIRHL